MKFTIATYTGKTGPDGRPVLARKIEEFDVPDPELTPEQQEIEVLKARVAALEAKSLSLDGRG